jgi:hypothetical protein
MLLFIYDPQSPQCHLGFENSNHPDNRRSDIRSPRFTDGYDRWAGISPAKEYPNLGVIIDIRAVYTSEVSKGMFGMRKKKLEKAVLDQMGFAILPVWDKGECYTVRPRTHVPRSCRLNAFHFEEIAC